MLLLVYTNLDFDLSNIIKSHHSHILTFSTSLAVEFFYKTRRPQSWFKQQVIFPTTTNSLSREVSHIPFPTFIYLVRFSYHLRMTATKTPPATANPLASGTALQKSFHSSIATVDA